MGFFLLACLLFAVTADAQRVTPNSLCPSVTLMEDFDMAKFVGPWHEVLRFHNWFDQGRRCNVDNYALIEGVWKNKYTVTTSWTEHKILKTPGNYTGEVRKHPEHNHPASLILKASNYQDWFQQLVLETDYKNYAVVYSCHDDWSGNVREFLWIESRKCNGLGDDKIKEILESLKKRGINVDSGLEKPDLNGCPGCPKP